MKEAGFSVHDKRFKHIHFNGGDLDITKSCYGASIPKQKAMSEDGDVIIAYKMNGVDIPRFVFLKLFLSTYAALKKRLLL